VAAVGSYEAAQKCAGSAFQRMGVEGLAPTPVNFTIFYHYFSGKVPQLKRAMDNVAASEKGFTDEICQALYDKCLGENQQRRLTSAVQAEIRRALEALSSLVDEAGRGAESYGNALDQFSDRMNAETGLNSLRQAVDNITTRTRAMKSQNEKLSLELSEATQNMDVLREDLESVRREALSDGLTGLGNRRYFDIELRTAVAEAGDAGQPLSLLMADIDKFKVLNDTFGHQTGDEVLKLVARIMKETVKGRDTPSRYGGEEFAVILPKTPMKGAMQLAEQIRAAVAGKRFVRRSSGTALGTVTLSLGVATLRAGDRTSDLIARADAALYAAKRQGRNRVLAETAAGAPPPATSARQPADAAAGLSGTAAAGR
jgi:diguanylate cyclase